MLVSSVHSPGEGRTDHRRSCLLEEDMCPAIGTLVWCRPHRRRQGQAGSGGLSSALLDDGRFIRNPLGRSFLAHCLYRPDRTPRAAAIAFVGSMPSLSKSRTSGFLTFADILPPL
jgi:hypothetical protein